MANGRFESFTGADWDKQHGNGQEPPEIDLDGDIRVAPEHDADVALDCIDIARDPIPPREWAVPDRIPARNVTLLSGEGAVGKSTLLLQLAVATVLGRDWIGSVPAAGPVMFLSCEDDADEVRRRLEAIAAHYQSSRAELANKLHVFDFVGRDAILGLPDRNGVIRPTPLFDRLKREAIHIKPKLLIIDTVADTFGGNEIDRAHTRQFINLKRDLAISCDGAVVMSSHPSLTGISTGTGMSGSTAWHNGPRARGYFKKATEVKDDDLRVLEWKKNNYGPTGERLLLRWRNGVFVPEPRAGSFDQMAADRKIEDLFIELLRRFTKEGRNVSNKASSTYAPTEFEKEPEAKERKASKDALADAMRRLFAADRIKVVTEGPPSRPRTRIVEVTP